jgi:quercetin dioxygenase-like cupin family protein
MAEHPRPPPQIVLQTPEVRVAEFSLAPGEGQPWHRHSEVADHFYCLEGLIEVRVRDPDRRMILRPGEKCTVQPGSVHHVMNASDATSRYLLIQGLGKYDFVRAD